MKKNRYLNWKVVLALIIIVVIILFSSLINFFVDLQWFGEVGYKGVYFTMLFTKFGLGVPIFIVLLLITYLYMLYLKREYIKYSSVIYSKDQIKMINRVILLISAIISAIASIAISAGSWYDILKFFNSTSFNIADPLFNKDVSFYIFRLPLLRELYGVVFGLLIIIAIITVLFYIITAATNGIFRISENGSNVLHMDRRGKMAFGREIIRFAGKQLAYIVSLIFLMIGVGYILKIYDIVYSPRGVAFGASYTDVNVTLMFNRVLIILSILAAVSVFYALYKRKVKLFLWVIGIMIGASIIQGVAETAVQKFVVTPNEVEKEQRFISYNIKYTKLAYGLDKIEEKDFPVEQNLTAQDIEKNRPTINNIRINDFSPALDVYNQLQGIRSYYTFNDVDIDRYNINGKYTQVFIAPRELDQSKISAQSLTWQNKHLFYTHGYGVTMSPVNTVTPEGQPNLIIKDIPPVSSVGIKVDRPEIYFGEISDDYIITNTKAQELDYPSGDTNKGTFYSGTAGIKLNPLNRLLFMINKGSLNFMLSQDIKSDSKIIMNRNIVKRVEKIAPFLQYDKDPYIVINNGKLYWIIDAYTVSSAYPYAEPYNGINYIRNSVKVIIDAYNGTTDFYMVDDKDPLVMTYNKIFPGLFKSIDKLPKGFVEHFRYPEDIFNIQLEVYKKYHMTDPRVFYNKEDLWMVAGENQAQGSNMETTSQENGKIEPSYIIMKLPGGTDEEFMLMNPYTPSNKDNMISWIGARMDGDNYGKLIVYKFPKQKVVYGPSQFKARIKQDTVISKELSLWNQQGSSVLIGNVITIPIEKSLLYVLPVYIKSTGNNSIPEMKRVVIGYGEKIVMDDNLEKGLTSLFNINPQQTQQTTPSQNKPQNNLPSNAQELVKQANDLFTKAKDAQQKGDWAQYGEYLKQLEEVLKQLNSAVK